MTTLSTQPENIEYREQVVTMQRWNYSEIQYKDRNYIETFKDNAYRSFFKVMNDNGFIKYRKEKDNYGDPIHQKERITAEFHLPNVEKETVYTERLIEVKLEDNGFNQLDTFVIGSFLTFSVIAFSIAIIFG